MSSHCECPIYMVSSTRDNLPRVTLDELTFNLFLYKFFQYAHAFLKYHFCLARQTNSIRLNAAWAINISWLVFTLKLSTIKISRAIDNNFFPAVRHFAEYVNRPGRCQISYKRSVKLSRGKVCLGY